MVRRLFSIGAFCTLSLLAACLGDAPPVAGASSSGGDGGPDGTSAMCTDGVQDGAETGIDCGGSCPACAIPSSCGDKVKDDTESDVDCGGLCGGCADGLACTTDADCVTGKCGADKTCADWGLLFVSSFVQAGFGPRSDALARDASGGVASLVYFNVPAAGSTLTFGGKMATTPSANQYYVLVRTDASGAVVWNSLLGNGNGIFATGLDFDKAGNLFAAAKVVNGTNLGIETPTSLGSYDGSVAKYDTTGKETKAIRAGANGGGPSELTSVKTFANGDVVVGGGCAPDWQINGMAGATIPAGNGEDFCVARLDSNLNVKWTQAFGGAGDDVVMSVAIDSKGDVVGTGYFLSTSLSLKIGAASKPFSNAGDHDVLAFKLSGADGSIQWATAAGSAVDDLPAGIDVGPNDDVLLTGQMTTTTTSASGQSIGFGATQKCAEFTCSYAARLSGGDGTQRWLKMFAGQQEVHSACTDKDGNLSFNTGITGGLPYGFGARLIMPPPTKNELAGTLAFADGDTLGIHAYGDGNGSYGATACSKTTSAVTIGGNTIGAAMYPGNTNVPAGNNSVVFTVDKIPLDPAAQ